MSGASTPVAGSSALGIGPSTVASTQLAQLGVTRNRTLLFQSFRDSVPRASLKRRRSHDLVAAVGAETSYANDKGKRKAGGTYYDASGDLRTEPDGLQDDASVLAADAGQLPPKWMDFTDEIDRILAGIRPKIAHLDRLHAKHVLPGFADKTAEEREIDAMTTDITRDFRRCSKLVSSLASSTTALQRRGGGATAREIAMAQNVQTALATKVQEASAIFRKKQSNYMQRLKGLEIRHHEVSGMGMGTSAGMSAGFSVGGVTGISYGRMGDGEAALREDLELSRQHLERAPNKSLQTQLLLEEEGGHVAGVDAQIAQRDQEIHRIAKSISELAELFQDLSALVIDQGTMLDRIDFNIEHMGQDLEKAVGELNYARHYQSRTSRGQCILFLVLCIMLLIAILIIKPFWHRGPTVAPSPSPREVIPGVPAPSMVGAPA